MNRKLVRNDQDVVTLLLAQDGISSVERLEYLLGIEFAYESGAFPSDVSNPSPEDDGTCNENVWRRKEGFESLLPESYPALVLYDFGEDMDRFGGIKKEILIYVYPEEFN